MNLETFKISVTDLRVTCSTTIYKNLSLMMRICKIYINAENREYNIIPLTSYFNGASTVNNKFVDTVDF